MVTTGQPFPVPGGTLSDHITVSVAAFEPLHLATYIGHMLSLAASSLTVIGRFRAFRHWPHSSLTFTGRIRALHSVAACEPYIQVSQSIWYSVATSEPTLIGHMHWSNILVTYIWATYRGHIHWSHTSVTFIGHIHGPHTFEPHTLLRPGV